MIKIFIYKIYYFNRRKKLYTIMNYLYKYYYTCYELTIDSTLKITSITSQYSPTDAII